MCCPSRDTWSGFYAGKVEPDALPTLIEHLDHCTACQSVLHTLVGATADADDALIASLRAASRPAGGYEEEVACGRVVEQIWGLVGGNSTARGAAPALPAERLGEYRILHLLGHGGMGAVYRAVHTRLGREVALKLVPPHRARDASAARFQREISAHGRLNHPNVVRATDAGEAHGVAFLVMDLVDGVDLDRLVKTAGPLGVADACELARQAAAGLQHLAEHELVHRDVKPSNVMLSRRGEVKVLDLGLAARIDVSGDGTAVTADGHILGSFDYLAPEQADPARPVDARADVYSLGCSLYYLLAGAPPYSGAEHATVRGKILAHTTGPVPRIARARPEVPAPLAAVLARMLAKNPEDRFPTAAAVVAALRPFCAGNDIERVLRSAGLEPVIPLAAPPHAEPLVLAPAAPLNRPGVRVRSVATAVLIALLIGGAGAAAARFWFRSPGAPLVVVKDEPTAPPEEVPIKVPLKMPAAPPAVPKVAAQPKPSEHLPVALLAIEERGSGVKDLGTKVGDVLFAKLASKPGLHLVDRADLKKVLDEQALSASGAVKGNEAVKVRRLTGAKLLVTGSVVQVDKRMVLVAKVIGSETGRVTAASVEGALSDDLVALASKLADAIEGIVAKQGRELAPVSAPITDRVAELNKELGAVPRPVLWVQVLERHVGLPASDPAAQTEVTRVAKELRFEALDPDVGGKGRADVLVTGEGFSEVSGRVGGLVGVRARVELRAVDRRTGKVLASDRQVALVVDLSEQVAGKAALQEAAGQLAERVLPKLVAPGPKK